MNIKYINSIKNFVDINKRIDEAILRVKVLDPSNPIEAQSLEMVDRELNFLLKILKTSYKKARIEEIGLKLV